MRKFNLFLLLLLALSFHKKVFSQGSGVYTYDKINRIIEFNNNGTIIKYHYDELGNRTASIINSGNICPGESAIFYAGEGETVSSFQWQVDSGRGFENISNNTIYSGTTTNTVTLSQPPTNLYGSKYRCVITNGSKTTTTDPVTLKFSVTWLGTANTSWENEANWACGKLPDEHTDVVINSGIITYPVINSNVMCRSINVNPSTTLKITDGYSLTITGK